MRTLSLRNSGLFGANGNGTTYGRRLGRHFIGGTVDEAADVGVNTDNLDQLSLLAISEAVIPTENNQPDPAFGGLTPAMLTLVNDLGLSIDAMQDDNAVNAPELSFPDYVRNTLTAMLTDPVPIYATRAPFLEPGNESFDPGTGNGTTPAPVAAGMGLGTLLLAGVAAWLLFGNRR